MGRRPNLIPPLVLQNHTSSRFGNRVLARTLTLQPLADAQRMQLAAALGPIVVRAADRLQRAFEGDGRAPASIWRELLEALHAHGDLMETPLGQLVTFTIMGRISKERGAGHSGTLPRSNYKPQ